MEGWEGFQRGELGGTRWRKGGRSDLIIFSLKNLKIDWYFWCSDRKEKLKAECRTTYLEEVEEEYSWGVSSQHIGNLGEVPDCPIHIFF